MANNMYKSNWCKDPEKCLYGVKCHFAHSFDELRRIRPCQYGQNCHDPMCVFAHSESELAAPRIPRPARSPYAGKDLRWTKMCRHSVCNIKSCTYAHSTDQLVKTEMCPHDDCDETDCLFAHHVQELFAKPARHSFAPKARIQLAEPETKITVLTKPRPQTPVSPRAKASAFSRPVKAKMVYRPVKAKASPYALILDAMASIPGIVAGINTAGCLCIEYLGEFPQSSVEAAVRELGYTVKV